MSYNIFPVNEFELSKEHQIYQDSNKTICVMSLSVACKRVEVCSEICCNWGRPAGILILGMIQEHLPRHQWCYKCHAFLSIYT